MNFVRKGLILPVLLFVGIGSLAALSLLAGHAQAFDSAGLAAEIDRLAVRSKARRFPGGAICTSIRSFPTARSELQKLWRIICADSDWKFEPASLIPESSVFCGVNSPDR